MPIPNEYEGIVDLLEQKTQQRLILWRESAGKDAVIVTLKHFSLRIQVVYDFHGEGVIVVDMLDSSGNELDSFRMEENDISYTRLYNLYEAGRRKARKIDKALQEFSAELTEEGEVGLDSDPDNSGNDIPF